jgi:hypothetical protein
MGNIVTVSAVMRGSAGHDEVMGSTDNQEPLLEVALPAVLL